MENCTTLHEINQLSWPFPI